MPPTRIERRARALAAARRLLEDEGAEALSMRRLAKASSMAVNTLYAMFSTRDGILGALVEQAVAARLEAIARSTPTAAAPVDRLEAMVAASVAHAVAHPGLTKPMYRAAAEHRELRRRATEVGIHTIRAGFADAVAAGQQRADVSPPLSAELLMQVVHEASLAWALGELGDRELAARCRYALAVILAAGATPATLPDLQTRVARAAQALQDEQERAERGA